MSLPLKSLSKLTCLWVASLLIFPLCFCISTAHAEETSNKEPSAQELITEEQTPFAVVDSFYEDVEEVEEKKLRIPLIGTSVYWKNGLHIAGHYKKLLFSIGGRFMLDSGTIDSDEQMQRACPELDGQRSEFRQARINVSAFVKDLLEARFDIDFANIQSIKDNWVRFTPIRILNRFRFGYMKEPFSLEEATSSRYTTFMERALPVQAFSPGRNFGIRYDRAVPDKRISWAGGVFVNTGSYNSIGDTKDKIDSRNGYSVSFRITGLPVYSDEGKRLLHIGLSYENRWGADEIQINAYPESRLTDDITLVDTGSFTMEGGDLINPEFAFVNGPLSVQGEYISAFVDADDDLRFWGFYLYGSYFLTGEHRKYSTGSGTFSGVDIKNDFHPRKGQWGAFELGLRYSYIDLNDKFIKGGKERNITIGLNWYLYPKIRCMFNYIHANVRDRTKPLIKNGNSDIFMVRLQFSL
jgi:phosphate-selective porin OprO/OprP